MLQLSRFSIGTGDRFGREGEAQIGAFKDMRAKGGEADIVWNKSNREHVLIGSTPADQEKAASESIKKTGWDGRWFVDADHITMKTVDWFLPYCNFFTIDVAESIGQNASLESRSCFLDRAAFLLEDSSIPVRVEHADLESVADKFLAAVEEAGKTYRHIAEHKPEGSFVVELSMDETDKPQTAAQIAAILVAVDAEKIPISTLAPRFPGKFLKGVDYIGDATEFFHAFEDEAKVLLWASEYLNLPKGLKLSVHSGSDKFKLYKGIHDITARLEVGVHLKTAGTTWLEEIVGLAEAGGKGLSVAKSVYEQAYLRIEELTAPYANVVEIDAQMLPSPKMVAGWDSDTFVAALRHEPNSSTMQPSMRQLMHVGFKIAAEMGREYLDALEECRESVSRNVRYNLYARHLAPIIFG
ncbi:MAG: tagaturonate epimerase family protein [Spirochaetota bacterium]|jgi:hypothetical protein|nr:tagaturonate epimerase family protein [Spirochaetota bacterium]OQC75014.1 MAG: hypothetical protein BWX44_00336 [Spirochaetes bacterium ADurb.Bin001]HQC16605.1 tagaturonate epimerase family protein [Rectinema sp.]